MPDSGSSKMIKAGFAHRTFTEADVEWISKVVDHHSAKLIAFWVRGQPNPDSAYGAIEVPEDNVGAVVQRFAQANNPSFGVRVYPMGTGAAGSTQSSTRYVGFATPGPLAWGPGQPSAGALEGTDPAATERA